MTVKKRSSGVKSLFVMVNNELNREIALQLNSWKHDENKKAGYLRLFSSMLIQQSGKSGIHGYVHV